MCLEPTSEKLIPILPIKSKNIENSDAFSVAEPTEEVPVPKLNKVKNVLHVFLYIISLTYFRRQCLFFFLRVFRPVFYFSKTVMKNEIACNKNI